MFHVPERVRVVRGALRSTEADGNNGAFMLRAHERDGRIYCIASDGEGWEHVSASLPNRCPRWDEMAFVKATFWDRDDAVIQIHPRAIHYIDNHPYCLHLWRKAGTNDYCEWPPSILVGIKSINGA